ncbi:MAG: MBOAT family O-acyltransferase [Vicingaceae bacterium]|nr:MBOAT family O-acyltransferase [Vicingaceae bacterium]
MLILIASYIFYGWWDWRFLTLILFSTLVDYAVGLKMLNADKKSYRKLLLWISLSVNLGLLGFFKYFNFFIESFNELTLSLGFNASLHTLQIILPVGISFYTFQTLSYSFDVYKKKLTPTKNFINFAAFVSFFPQLVAGPIERASNLLPQIQQKRKFSYTLSMQGFYQIAWGLFKKVVIADNCAPLVNEIFASDYSMMSGSLLLVGAILFAFQIYGDFSGYSDIAIGVSKLFGFQLMTNFKFPYFSRNIGEFWRKWHISLSTWFRDYLYIPLGGSKVNKWLSIRNVFVIFLVSGFWHGANWTFLVWGAFHALLFLPSFFMGNNKKYHLKDVNLTSIKETTINGLLILRTFLLVTIGWIFFRADNISQAFIYIKNIFSTTLLKLPMLRGDKNTDLILTVLFISILLMVEWKNRNNEFVFENLLYKSIWKQFSVIGFIVLLMYYFTGTAQDFIYFQF